MTIKLRNKKLVNLVAGTKRNDVSNDTVVPGNGMQYFLTLCNIDMNKHYYHIIIKGRSATALMTFHQSVTLKRSLISSH